VSFRLPGWVGVAFQTLGGEQQRLPARQACISLAVRDCHRERDSPPEGLSLGLSNIGGVGVNQKKYDTQELSNLCG